jgi:glutamyl-Q tRNA(Asp) synthetase
MPEPFGNSGYVGRFAPSPTGPLHFGSLLAALASYLDAKSNRGIWLLRIEDLDPPRQDPTADAHFVEVLNAFGLNWDREIRFQSHRGKSYQAALDRLIESGHAFPCSCSRKELAGHPHQGRCQPDPNKALAWRFLANPNGVSFEDQLQGFYYPSTPHERDDFVIRRRDTLWSYQLAVVVDDQDQGVTHVMRGIDLIDSTPRQIQLQRALGYRTPNYAHLPIAVETNGQKLSKQNLALPLGVRSPERTLYIALQWLRQAPPKTLAKGSIDEILQWAIGHWDLSALKGQTEAAAPAAFQKSVRSTEGY